MAKSQDVHNKPIIWGCMSCLSRKLDWRMKVLTHVVGFLYPKNFTPTYELNIFNMGNVKNFAKVMELSSKSHKQPVYLLNGFDGVKIKMRSPAMEDEIKYASGKIGMISIQDELHMRTVEMAYEITKEQYEDKYFPDDYNWKII